MSVSLQAGTDFLREVPNIHGLAIEFPGDLADISQMHDLRSLLADIYVDDSGRVDETTRISDEDLQHISGLTQLRHIDFSHSAIEGSGLVHLQAMSELRTLELGRTPLSEGLDNLSGLVNLEELHLNDTEVADEDVAHLSTLENLELLDLNTTAVTDVGMPAIGELSALRILRLSDNPISDAGLPPLIRLPNLEEIRLGRTLVTDYGVMMFREDVVVWR